LTGSALDAFAPRFREWCLKADPWMPATVIAGRVGWQGSILADTCRGPGAEQSRGDQDLWDRPGVVVEDLASRVLVLDLPAGVGACTIISEGRKTARTARTDW
jgi:hypothetical protein